MIDVTVKGFENLAKAFESASLSADKLRQALTVGISQAADAAAALEEDRRFMGRRPVPMTPIEPPRWDVTKGAKWDSSATSLMVLAASAGDFTVPHGLGVSPDAAFVRECSGGTIGFRTSSDRENLYLWASAPGAQARIEMHVSNSTVEKELMKDMLRQPAIASTHRFVGGSIDGQEQYCDDCGKLFDDPCHAVLGWDSGSSSTVREQEPSRLAATKRKFRKL